ncbi:restriction endonuclease [Streptomyces sp. NPDC012888]|uniref:restriction endonuclease n=1 Tax=Streptomyces sp. NPDC012888 TaxID=3364855 RepID=UPI0036C0C15B
MSSRRANGLIGAWAEAQRRQQRERLAREREAERRQREHERELARGRREQQAAYRQYREGEARRRTEELEARVAALRGLLAAGCRTPAFRLSTVPGAGPSGPFPAGGPGQPVPLPRIEDFRPRPGESERAAHARYTRAWQAARAAEAERQRELVARPATARAGGRGRQGGHGGPGGRPQDTAGALRAGDPETVVEYFSAALYASPAWPGELPRRVSAAYDRMARQLVLEWELPGVDVVPAVKAVRYVATADEDRETARPVTQRRALYREVLAQCVLLVLREVYAADEFGVLDSVVVNGFTDGHDPVTGRRTDIVLAAVTAARAAFTGLRLEQVSPVDCLVEGLGGRLSARPDQQASVRPERAPADVGGEVVTHGDGLVIGEVPEPGADEPDLFTMDPLAFEGLVAELFRAMGMDAVTTRRSGDGGVDVEAVDPAPIRGGRIVVQVKRYRNTVPPTAVRDLYGTVQDAGANKGVLVTTSSFGPGSRSFAEGKPLELVSGPELVELLHRHGLRGRLGAPVPRQRPARREPERERNGERGPAGAHNVLGMNWAGRVVLDVCALVCEGGRVLDEDHFVFFNNPRTPDGSVRTRPRPAPDKAALEVDFGALPAAADRLVLVAAVDPEADPGADLAGFTDAAIRLLDASGGELDRLEVSDGRPGETALVLGSFRRRAGGDWNFVIGGRGYRGGLAELLGDFGVEVA